MHHAPSTTVLPPFPPSWRWVLCRVQVRGFCRMVHTLSSLDWFLMSSLGHTFPTGALQVLSSHTCGCPVSQQPLLQWLSPWLPLPVSVTILGLQNGGFLSLLLLLHLLAGILLGRKAFPFSFSVSPTIVFRTLLWTQWFFLNVLSIIFLILI